MPSNCVCPDGNCHHGRNKGDETKPLCDKCIDLWFRVHLRHRIEKMLKPDGAESKCIVMRSLLQFLGLTSRPDPDAKTFELCLEKAYRFARLRGATKVTYEVRADNLGGKSFDDKDLGRYKSEHGDEAKLLARFLYGVHVHTAHLTWGANHSDEGAIWDINDSRKDETVVREICRLLKERLYGARSVPWDANYAYCGA